ncbi:MAG: protein disulfide oxidoreductase [Gammaproteobacteria bacterium]|nr:protein disulfide oxidoreductase [Gammaproteobacteria bacterium]MDH5735176.1 protein disulfide oxidoreductase [Gammaproteobacteria bacterium]
MQLTNWLSRHSWVKIILQLMIVLIVYSGIRTWQQRDVINGKAPNIQGYLLDNQNIELDQHLGEPVLVYFWASWCPVCKMTGGSIDSIAKDYQVITIASWSGDAAAVREYLQDNRLTMPVLVDNEGRWAKQYGIKGVPTSFVIDRAGEIQFIESGYTTEVGLRSRLWWLTKKG